MYGEWCSLCVTEIQRGDLQNRPITKICVQCEIEEGSKESDHDIRSMLTNHNREKD